MKMSRGNQLHLSVHVQRQAQISVEISDRRKKLTAHSRLLSFEYSKNVTTMNSELEGAQQSSKVLLTDKPIRNYRENGSIFKNGQ